MKQRNKYMVIPENVARNVSAYLGSTISKVFEWSFSVFFFFYLCVFEKNGNVSEAKGPFVSISYTHCLQN